MRYFLTVLMLLCISWMLMAQQKLVVTSQGDVVPLKPGESSLDVVKRLGLVKDEVQSGTCTSSATFGFTPDLYNCTLDFVGYHRDTWGQWFKAPADGKIDSFYFRTAEQNEMQDSAVKIAIWRSTIWDSSGPGFGSYGAARSAWGYFPASALVDDDQGITPFFNQANGPWVSTVTSSYPSSPPSFPPFDSLLWGSGAGYSVHAHMDPVNGSTTTGGPINGIKLRDYSLAQSVNVTKGFKLFITMQQQGAHDGADNTHPATWCQSSTNPPSRNWKFYEHPTGPSRGWQARAEANWNWWLVMTATSDVPPKFLSMDQLGHTLFTTARHVQAHIQDCNPQNNARAGVQSASLTYTVGSNSPVQVTMSHPGADLYEADIPGASAGTHIKYSATAVDSNGNTAQSVTVEYSVVSIGDSYYGADTAATYNWVEINGTGIRIPKDKGENPDTSWFNTRGKQSVVRDDGTWGPADMGEWFTYFGDSVRYAWLGTNGSMSVTKSSTDTMQQVGSGGSVPSSWILPSTILGVNNDVPNNLISPYINDFSLAPESTGYEGAHGNVYFQADPISHKFIVEWDSVGILHLHDTAVTFEVIFDNTDNSVKFQYQNIGVSGGDSAQSELIGIQGDTTGGTPPFIMLNKVGTPRELRPRNVHAFKFSTGQVPVSVAAGWNMVSVPVYSHGYLKTGLFPSAISNAFGYKGGYVVKDTLSIGAGYWLKFGGGQTLFLPQIARVNSDTITLANKWNMIGSISVSVPIASITYLPDETTVKGSNYFGFGIGGYSSATTIEPGKGYWFKSKIAGGQLVLQGSSNTPKIRPQSDPLSELSQIKIRDWSGSEQTLYFGSVSRLTESVDFFEMPPAPPATFDARFASQRMVEVHPATLSGNTEFPIQIQSAVYPITVSWGLKQTDGVGYELSDINGTKGIGTRILKTNGSLKITSPVQGLVIRAKIVSNAIPTSYTLEQNYPNPFNPTTSLKYALPHDSHVRLTVFNVIGQEISVLVDENQQKGFHEVMWNAHNLLNGQIGSGVYFYRIDATNIADTKDVFSQVRKMILLK